MNKLEAAIFSLPILGSFYSLQDDVCLVLSGRKQPDLLMRFSYFFVASLIL